MADDEEEEEEEEEQKGVKQLIKGGTKRVPYCGYPVFFPAPFEYFPVVGLSCKTPGSALPTRIFQCMKPKRSELPCAPAPTAAQGAGDQYPPQGGTLKQTCGVKAQFLGEIIVKKEIPPKDSEDDQPCGEPAPPRTPPCPSPCPSPCPNLSPRPIPPEWNEYECLRNMAPMCGPIYFPLQPEIPDDCRRKLQEFGPDSSRPHPCGPAEEPVVCPHPCGHPAQDVLPYGHADSYETVRTREEIVVDSLDPCMNPCPEKKYVKVEDTFRRTRSYNPAMDGYPPPLSCGYACSPCGTPCCSPCGPCGSPCDPCNPCRPCGSSCSCGPCASSCSCGPCGSPCCNPCGPCPPCGGSCGPCYQPCPPPRAPSPSHCPAACTPQKLYDERVNSPYGCIDEYEPPKCPPPCDDPYIKARQEEKQDVLFKRSPICPCDNTCKTPCRGTPCG